MCMKSFKKCCISNEMDGTEGDAILSDYDESNFPDLDIQGSRFSRLFQDFTTKGVQNYD